MPSPYSRSDRTGFWIAIGIVALTALIILSSITGCSATELGQAARDNPALAPTTQLVERVQQPIDGIAAATTQIAQPVKDLADAGADFGIPGASIVGGIAGLLLGIATLWLGRRGKLPQAKT